MKQIVFGLAALTTVAHGDLFDDGIKQYESKQYAAAKTTFERVVASKQHVADAKKYLGRTLMKLQQDEDAVDVLEEAVELAPNDAEAHYYFAAASCRYAQQASVFSQMGLAGDCRDHAQTAYQLKPDYWEARKIALTFFLQAPGIVGGGIDKAKALQADTAKLDPAYGNAFASQIAIKEQKWDEAFTLLQNAVSAKPEVADFAVDLGGLLSKQKKYPEAAQQYEAVTKKFPDEARAYFHFANMIVEGKIEARYGEGELALQHFFSADNKKGAPSEGWGWLVLNELYTLMGKTDEAQKALANAGKDPDQYLQKEIKKKS